MQKEKSGLGVEAVCPTSRLDTVECQVAIVHTLLPMNAPTLGLAPSLPPGSLPWRLDEERDVRRDSTAHELCPEVEPLPGASKDN